MSVIFKLLNKDFDLRLKLRAYNQMNHKTAFFTFSKIHSKEILTQDSFTIYSVKY